MESKTVEPEALDLSEHGVSDALREAVEEEMEFLEGRGVKLVRMRADDDGEVFQVTIHAGDEMYRMSEVAPGNVSRTVFRDPEADGAMPYQEDEEEEGEGEKETGEAVEEEEGGEEAEESEEADGETEDGEPDEKDGGGESEETNGEETEDEEPVSEKDESDEE